VSGRRRTGILAALAGALLVALALGLLLLPGRQDGTAPGAEPAVAPAAAPGGAAPPAPRPRAGLTPAAAAPSRSPGKRKQEPLSLEVVATLEDGTPVQGVTFLGMERGDGGGLDVGVGADALSMEGTDTEGRSTLRWKERPEEILLLVIGRRDEVVAVGSGTLLSPDTSGEVVAAAPGPGPLRLTMRPRAGIGSVLLLDAGTGDPVLERRWEMRVRLSDGTARPGGGGYLKSAAVRIQVEQPFLPRPSPHAADERVLEVEAEGHETACLPLASFRGSGPLYLQPKTPSVVGDIVVLGPEQTPWSVGVSLWPRGRPLFGDAPKMKWPPFRNGPFRLYDIPDGEWTLLAVARGSEGLRWARREFQKSGATVDLGRVELLAGSGFRVRLLDAAGAPVARTVFWAVMLDEPSPRAGTLLAVSWDELRFRFDHRAAEVQPSGKEWDPEGWFEIPNLAPATRFRVASPEHPCAWADAVTPTESGVLTTVELRIPPRLTECHLRFTVRGRVPAQWGAVEYGIRPYPSEDGLFLLFPPGRRSFDVPARLTKDGSWEVFHGDVEIPDQSPFEATVDLE